jgi:hypothetical protein
MKRFASYLSAALSVLLLIVSVAPASAATPTVAPPTTGSSAGLGITPRKNYVINPGQTVTDKLIIRNLDSTADLNLSLRMIDFTYMNQSGTPKLNLDANAERNVALNASGVTLAFVSVPGKVSENMTLQKFGAYNSTDAGASGSYVFIAFNDQPNMIAYTLKNAGNVFESPAGNVIVKDIFGHQVANVSTNSNQSLALIGQSRIFASCIKTVYIPQSLMYSTVRTATRRTR